MQVSTLLLVTLPVKASRSSYHQHSFLEEKYNQFGLVVTEIGVYNICSVCVCACMYDSVMCVDILWRMTASCTEG